MSPHDEQRTILITGATGKQGGAVARHLAGKAFRLRAMTRKLDSPAAKALVHRGVEVVHGDLDDAASVNRALEGVWGVFAVQNTWEAGVAREEEQGKRIARLARERGVQHFVYTSVGSAGRETGIPHFENKWRIEETVRSLGFPTWAILRPVFFMENLLSPWSLRGERLAMGLSPSTVLQMVAVDDIGRYGAQLFERAEALSGTEIELAGDAVTLLEAADVLAGTLKRKIKYVPIPIEQVLRQSKEMAAMLEWFERTGYDVDIAGLERRIGIRPLTLPEWAEQYAREA